MEIAILVVVAITVLLFAARVIKDAVTMLYNLAPLFVLWLAMFLILDYAGVLNQESDMQNANYIGSIENTSGSGGNTKDWNHVEIFSTVAPRSKGKKD